MSYDRFIQSRTIAKRQTLGAVLFPSYVLSSFIEFETDGYLVGMQFMSAHNSSTIIASGVQIAYPSGAMIAKVSGDSLAIPQGGNVTDYSGAQIFISHLSYPSSDGSSSLESDSRQTTIAYDADSKRIPVKSNDRLGVYLCSNAGFANINFSYTLTAYFVRS